MPYFFSSHTPPTHTGAFGSSFRQKLWKDVWLKDLRERGVPVTANVDPLWVLATESKSATWQTEVQYVHQYLHDMSMVAIVFIV